MRIEQREARRGNARDPNDDVLATEPDKQADRAEGNKGNEERVSDESRLGKFQKATELIGKGVRNHSDEPLGDIKDLMIDLSAGRVSYAVLSIGGFLGMGDKLVAIPVAALISRDDGSLLLNADRKRLEGAPSFDEKRWPDFSNPVWGASIYKYHGQEPYWESRAGGDDEVSRETGRDAEVRVGASDADREIVRKIRRGIVADEQLSFSAKNVHIDVEDGRVTLRGTVRSEEEKRDMAMRAKATAGVKEVRNDLEVKRD